MPSSDPRTVGDVLGDLGKKWENRRTVGDGSVMYVVLSFQFLVLVRNLIENIGVSQNEIQMAK